MFALVLGTLAGLRLSPLVPWVPLLLAMLGAALGRRWGWCVCAVAVGLLNVQLQPPVDGPGEGFAVGRPVVLWGRVESHPVCEPREGCRLRLVVERLKQGILEERAGFPLWVALPPELVPPVFGSRLRVRGYLRRRGADGNEPPSKAGSWRLRLKSKRFLVVEKEAPPWWKAVDEVRGRLAVALWSGGGGKAAPLVGALVLGDRSRLPKAWRQALKRCGLAHLLAVSGLHVASVALLAFVPGLPWPLRLRCLLAAVLVLAYVLLLGPRPSLLRAAAMAVLALLALALERPPQAANALACGVSALILWQPSLVDDLGFQLSATATVGILMLTPRWELHLRWLPRWLRRPLAASLAAQLITLPLLWPLEGGLHPLAPLFGLVALPWLALFLALSFAWLAAALLAPVLAPGVMSLLDLLATPVEALAALPSSPWFLLPVHPPAAFPWLLLALALLLTRCWPEEMKMGWGAVFGGSMALTLLALTLLALALALAVIGTEMGWRGVADSENPGVEVLMLDVGQGDALVLRDGEEALLIDGGGWPAGDFGGRRLVPVLAAAGVDRLRAVVLTHPDLDHCGGLVDVARYLVVEEVWSTPFAGRSPCGGELVTSPGTRWRRLWRGDGLSIGRFRLRVLHPGAAAPRRGEKVGGNGRSLVLMAEVFGHRLLFTGDIEAAAELHIRRRFGGRLAADVLKVAHHGSRSSTTPAFLRAVAPRLALVSVGANNPYGHPTAEVLGRLRKAGVQVLRTDLHGMVRLRISPAGVLSWTTVKTPVGSVDGAGSL